MGKVIGEPKPLDLVKVSNGQGNGAVGGGGAPRMGGGGGQGYGGELPSLTVTDTLLSHSSLSHLLLSQPTMEEEEEEEACLTRLVKRPPAMPPDLLPILPNHSPRTYAYPPPCGLHTLSPCLSPLSAAPPSRPGLDGGGSPHRPVFPIASLSPYQSKSAPPPLLPLPPSPLQCPVWTSSVHLFLGGLFVCVWPRNHQ